MGALRILRWLLLFLITVHLCSCGFSPPRLLESITVTPATADAANFSNGQVQFTAMGHYSAAPLDAKPQQLQWAVDSPPWLLLAVTDNVVIDGNGSAHCKAGYFGSDNILAIAPANPNLPIDGMGHNAVVGMAQITCP